MTFSATRYRSVWYVLSGIMIVASMGALATWGLRFGIDFTGGSLMAVRFETRPSVEQVVTTLRGIEGLDIGQPVVQPVGETEMYIRSKELTQEQYGKVLEALRANNTSVEEQRFETVGPVIGDELRTKSLQGVMLALILIVLYIAYTFRKVSAPVASWKYGVVTMVAALHDVLVPLGVFAALGHYRGVEVGTPFIAAMLTILGYSITDTIVVMDRVRENLPKIKGTFAEIMDDSLAQTYRRSFYTSATTLFALLAIFFFGGASLHEFSLAMIIGISVGTYSSLFIASTLLVSWNEWVQARQKKA